MMLKSDAIQEWRRRLKDAERSGYTVLAERLIAQFLETLLAIASETDASGPESLRHLSIRQIFDQGLYGDTHIKTLSKWAKDGRWQGGRRKYGDRGPWLIPEKSVYADLVETDGPQPEDPGEDGTQEAGAARADQKPARHTESGGVSRRLRRRGRVKVGVSGHARLHRSARTTDCEAG